MTGGTCHFWREAARIEADGATNPAACPWSQFMYSRVFGALRKILAVCRSRVAFATAVPAVTCLPTVIIGIFRLRAARFFVVQGLALIGKHTRAHASCGDFSIDFFQPVASMLRESRPASRIHSP